MRNKLFSAINIIGLSISMSVGLLLIAIVLDLRSYDRFNENGERIYRISSILTSNREHGNKYATTSVRAARLIREKLAGVDAVTMLRGEFPKDVIAGTRALPIKGYWADPSLFSIFTFPMLEGDPVTALRAPYSIVLTETAARKLFGDGAAFGQSITIDSVDYQVTGILKDIPFFSHIQFEALASLATIDAAGKTDSRFDAWTNLSMNYVYILLSKNADVALIQSQLNAIAAAENINEERTRLELALLPLYETVVGEEFQRTEGGSGTAGVHMSPRMLWILGGLALVVIVSACFNYTNLSMARAMRRFKEIGLRKAVGAGKAQVQRQFLAEAVIISLAALMLSCLQFVVLRSQLINIAPEVQQMVTLELTPTLVVAFIVFAVAVGVVAGFLPSMFFSNINAVQALRNVQSLTVFKHMTLRRALIVIQYTVTLMFITATTIGYVQYKAILTFDLGFNTENILNIDVQGNNPDALQKTLNEMPEVTGVSRSLIVTSVGNAWGGYMRYRDLNDSALVMTNHVDENYLPLHEYELITGKNFSTRPTTTAAISEVIVNEQFLKRFHIGNNDPGSAIGEELTFSSFSVRNRKMTIVGVMKDFHYGKIDNRIGPVALMPWTPGDRTIVNVKLKSADMLTTLKRIEALWKKIDPVHPFEAKFFDEEIENAYSEFSVQIKIIGLLSFLAISIASMGLFGMVVFTTETRLKEISIRKVMGAGAGSLIYLLSRGFLTLLGISSLIAIPVTYVFFENIVLTNFPYHTPVQFAELFSGLLAVLLIACILIGVQTIRAVRSNPATALKSE